jgi:hypothetical protein
MSETKNIVGRDTDGTTWVTVRCYIDIDVIADNAEDAIYHAGLILEANTGIKNTESFEFTPLEVE